MKLKVPPVGATAGRISLPVTTEKLEVPVACDGKVTWTDAFVSGASDVFA